MFRFALIFSLVLVVAPAFAQQPAPEDYQAAISALQAQRDVANNQIVQLSVDLSRAKAELAKLKKDKEDVK